MRSNMFANIENKFKSATKDEIINTAWASALEIKEALEDERITFGLLLTGAQLGVAGDRKINKDEKELIDEIFGEIWTGDLKDLYKEIEKEIDDSVYELVNEITQLQNDVAISFLYYILSFAYIDGKFEEEVAESLDELFGMNLLVDFVQSGEEEVPSQETEVKITKFEKELISYIKEKDSLVPLKDIASHFPNKSETEIKKALDSLCDKEILFGGEEIFRCMYGAYD